MHKNVSIVAHWWFQYTLAGTAERQPCYARARRTCATIPSEMSFLSPSSSQVIESIIQTTRTSKENGKKRRQKLYIHPARLGLEV
jgi:hypothetical protein